MKQTINLTERLIEQCKKGDERARYAVYKQYVHAMYNVSHRITGNQFDAEDVVQEAFVKAFKKINTLKQVHTFGGWLKQIVVNESISLVRRQKRLKQAFETIDSIPDAEEEPLMDNNIPMEKVMAAIMQLPEGARVVFTLRAIEEYKFNEIAEMTGQTVNNCKVQYHRSKKILSSQLKESVYAN